MPWHISSDHAGCDGYAVVKDETDDVVGCHRTREEASRHMAALYASEAKSAGFDVKVLRQLIRIRKQEPAEIEEQETLLDVYRRALGM